MSIIYGALGALFVIVLFAVGGLVGWLARAKFYRAKAESPEEAELRRMQEEQDAFRQVQNYNADVAYGIKDALEALEGSEAS